MKTSETLYCAMDVAASIIHCSNQIGYGINYLHLQKLLYFVQAYSFILYGKPIFVDDIYAVTYGAHVPDVAQYYRRVSASIFGILLIACAMLCFREGANNKVDYIITKIETFTDYEKVNTDNRVVQLLKDNVFLVEMKNKKNNDK